MRTLTAAVCLIWMTVAAGAEPPAPQTRPLSLEDCLVIALQHNLDIQIERYNPMMARYTLSGSYGVYDPTFNFSGEHDYRLSPGGIDQQGRAFNGNETDTDTFGTGLGGMLPWGLTYDLGGSASDQTGTRPSSRTGTNVVGFVTNTFVNVNPPFDTFNVVNPVFNRIPTRSPFETTSAQVGALTLRQPLLKNFWIDQPRLQIYVNKREVKRSDEVFRGQVMLVVTSVEDAYYNLIYNEENVRVQEMALELAERLLAENKKRVEVGALAPLDEKQAQSQAATSRANLLAARAARDTAQRDLKDLLSDDYTNTWAEAVVSPTDKLVAVPETYDLQESWRKGLAQQPALVQARLTLEELKERVRFQRNQLFPQLDAFGTYGYSGSSKEYSGALGQIAGRDSPFYSFGAQISIPLSRVAERNAYKAAKAAHEQQQLTLRRDEQTTLITIENDIATAMSSYESVDATHQARLYAEAALEAEQKKLENGKSTSFVVLQLQTQLTTARSAEIRALADYNIALAKLALDEGTTLERREIDIKGVGAP